MQHDNDNGEPLRFLSVCSGIEAASVAWGPLGWKAVAFAEIEKFPSAVLAHHYPDVPNLGDFTKIDTTKLGRVDILCGGTPCQAFSVAGLRGGLDDARGNLTLKFVELAHALAAGNGLRNVVWENVVGVLSDKGNAFGCFLGGLVGADAAIEPPTRGKWGCAGLVAGPKGRAAWRILDAQYFGLAQRRRRVIVVADFGNGADPAEVLFERKGVQRHTPPSREKGKGTSRGFEVGPSGGSFTDVAPTLDCRAKNGPVQNQIGAGVVHAPEIARCVATREGSSQDYETTTMLAVSVTGDVAHTLKAEGADASEDGTGRGTPIVSVMHETGQGWWKEDAIAGTLRAEGENRPSRPSHVIAFTAKDYGGDAAYDVSPTLRAGGHSGSHANAGVMPAITVAIRGREGGATAELGGEVATALRASQGGGDKPHVLATREVAGALTSNYGKQLDNSDTALGPNVAIHHSAVRRLTPVECERLQGFPDEYTNIPWRGKPTSPDGPRYKALGNSWAVPLFAWLGRRIDMHMPPLAANDNKEAARAA